MGACRKWDNFSTDANHEWWNALKIVPSILNDTNGKLETIKEKIRLNNFCFNTSQKMMMLPNKVTKAKISIIFWSKNGEVSHWTRWQSTSIAWCTPQEQMLFLKSWSSHYISLSCDQSWRSKKFCYLKLHAHSNKQICLALACWRKNSWSSVDVLKHLI